jgi:hypothetical protein
MMRKHLSVIVAFVLVGVASGCEMNVNGSLSNKLFYKSPTKGDIREGMYQPGLRTYNGAGEGVNVREGFDGMEKEGT